MRGSDSSNKGNMNRDLYKLESKINAALKEKLDSRLERYTNEKIMGLHKLMDEMEEENIPSQNYSHSIPRSHATGHQDKHLLKTTKDENPKDLYPKRNIEVEYTVLKQKKIGLLRNSKKLKLDSNELLV